MKLYSFLQESPYERLEYLNIPPGGLEEESKLDILNLILVR